MPIPFEEVAVHLGLGVQTQQRLAAFLDGPAFSCPVFSGSAFSAPREGRELGEIERGVEDGDIWLLLIQRDRTMIDVRPLDGASVSLVSVADDNAALEPASQRPARRARSWRARVSS